MAVWTAPTTRSTGALVSASIWNTDIVENLKYLKDSPVFDGDISVSDDLLLTSSGAVINFASNDVTITHSTNTLTFAGASSGYVFNDGSVGIGTASPDARLDVDAGATALAARVQGTNAPYLSVLDNDNAVEALVAADGANGVTVFGSITNHAVQFRTNNSERMRIDSSGRALVGTTAAISTSTANLQVVGSGATGSASFAKSDITTSGGSIVGIDAWAYDGSVYNIAGTINFRAAENWSSTNHGTDLQFRLVPSGAGAGLTERMRLTSGGNLAIGATARLYLDGTAGTGNTYIEEYSADNLRVVAGGALTAQFKTAVVEIYGNGSQYNWDGGAYYPSTDNARNLGGSSNRWAAVYAANGTIQTSDRTRKRDISSDTLGLDFVQRLRPVSFVMNDESDEVRRHGLIAQDVIEAALGASLAGILSGTREGEYGLNYAGFVPALIRAVQQQQTEIDALKARLN